MSTARRTIATLEELSERLRAQWEPGRRRIIGVAGGPGAGKTTLVEALVAASARGAAQPPGWIAHVPMDGFHLADAALERLGRLSRKGAPDTFDVGGYATLLRRTREERDRIVYAPSFGRELEQPIAGSIAVMPDCTLLLTEGNYLLLDEADWREVRAQLDEVWFLDADDAVRRARLVERHVRFGKTRVDAQAWVRDVDEPNARLIEATRPRADVLIAGTVLEGSSPSA